MGHASITDFSGVFLSCRERKCFSSSSSVRPFVSGMNLYTKPIANTPKATNIKNVIDKPTELSKIGKAKPIIKFNIQRKKTLIPEPSPLNHRDNGLNLVTRLRDPLSATGLCRRLNSILV